MHRLYTRIIHPALIEFAPSPDVPGGEVDSMDAFLEKARTATHNALCYEVRRSFALIIGGTFERQLRFWLIRGAPEEREKIETASWAMLSGLVESLREISFHSAGISDDIQEMWLVVNAVRHGDGRSIDELAKRRPSMWDHLPTERFGANPTGLAGDMRVKDSDLYRYFVATLRFWCAAGASSIPGLLSAT